MRRWRCTCTVTRLQAVPPKRARCVFVFRFVCLYKAALKQRLHYKNEGKKKRTCTCPYGTRIFRWFGNLDFATAERKTGSVPKPVIWKVTSPASTLVEFGTCNTPSPQVRSWWQKKKQSDNLAPPLSYSTHFNSGDFKPWTNTNDMSIFYHEN